VEHTEHRCRREFLLDQQSPEVPEVEKRSMIKLYHNKINGNQLKFDEHHVDNEENQPLLYDEQEKEEYH
jgi:hypothetical protein